MMIDGRWHDEDRTILAGGFVRQPSVYGGEIESDVVEAMAAEPSRFCLIASLSCPWSHRTLIVRALKGLEAALPIQIAGGARVEGYAANGGAPWRVPGSGRTIVHLHQLYTLGEPDYTGRVTVPLLWDSHARRIVSNESVEIMRALDAIPALGGGPDFALAPPHLAKQIDALNARMHHELADAVYRAGLARRQEAYESAVDQVFAALDELEARLAGRRYLFGAVVTDADWRLFSTLVRFDQVYHTHFRCTRHRLVDYAHLWAYARDLYGWRGVAATVDFVAIREGYYRNDGDHNPHGIVAVAPDVDWTEPHGRETLGPARIARRTGATSTVDPITLMVSDG